MKRDGFTLIELLAVIMILAFIMAITIPSIKKAIESSENKLYNVVVSQIKKGAKSYAMDYKEEIPNFLDTGTGFITINEMIDEGVLEPNIENPKTGESFSGDEAVIVAELPSGDYSYEFLIDGKLILDGLVLWLDAFNAASYPESGDTWYDISGNEKDSDLIGPIYDEEGNFQFRGQGERDGNPTGDYVSLDEATLSTNPTTKPDGVTYQWWMKFDGDQPNGHAILRGSGTINHLEWRGDTTTGYWRTEAKKQNGYSFGGGSDSNEIGDWFNMALVFANNETDRPVRWYKNGELFHTGNMTEGTYPDEEYFSPTSFGRSTGNSSYYYVQSFF